MKDIHSHILYEIDDGSESIDESINIIKQAIDNGYTDIILTPHYRRIQKYTKNNKVKKELFNNLLKEVKKEKLKINLYLGNEITVDEDLFYYLDTDQVLTLNDSKYILLELPFTGRIKYLDDLFDELLNKGYIPIVPHPERYHDYKIEDYVKWNKLGILFQGNIETLYGGYGKKNQLILEKMLKMHLISFMGSDIHKDYHLTYKRDIKNKLKELLDDSKMIQELVDININKVIKNMEVKPYELIEEKKKFKLFNR